MWCNAIRTHSRALPLKPLLYFVSLKFQRVRRSVSSTVLHACRDDSLQLGRGHRHYLESQVAQNNRPLGAGPSLPGRRARYWHSTQANWAGVCVSGAAMVPLPATWMDIMDVKAWRPVMLWRKTSLVYFKVMSLGQTPQAILVDPCFANGLGASRNHRQLLTLPHAVKLQGYHVPHLSEGEVYVASWKTICDINRWRL